MLLAGPYRPFWAYVRSLRSNAVALNSAYSIGSYVSMAVLQGLQFFLLARALGSHEFGVVASVVAITSAFVPFCSLGLGNVAIMHLTRGQARADESLGNGLAVTAITAAAGIALSLLVGWAFLNEPGVLGIVLLFAFSEILLNKCVDIAAHVFLGLERQLVAVFFYNFQMFVRTGCAVVLYLGWTHQTALAWAQLHMAAGVVTTVVILFVSVRLLGRPRTKYASAIADIRKGVFFSILFSAKSLNTDVDKIVLARLASATTAGTYTAAFRLVNLTCLPITAILFSLQARIFRKGHEGGLIGTVDALRQLLNFAAAYCLLLAVAIYVAAPAVPLLLGESYRLTVDIVRWLCLLPFFMVVQLMGSAALSGADAQPRVSLLHALTAALALLLNLLLVPGLGWRGAVIAAYGAQGFLIAGLVYSIMKRVQAERKASR